MTFQEWRAAWPGIAVSQPYPDAPDVYFVQDRDPLIPSVQTPPREAMFALRALTDYHVTSENPHRGSIWVAPRSDRDDWTRADYMANRCSHEAYYLSLARFIGWNPLCALVRQVAPIEALIAAFDGDSAGNKRVPLTRWDAYDGPVRRLLKHEHMARSWSGVPLPAQSICWSLSESVCVLKAVARELVRAEKET